MGKSLQESFSLWKASGEVGTFDDYLQHLWGPLIPRYKSRGFNLIPCPRRQKYSCAGLDSYGETVPDEIILWNIKTGGNIALATGPSGVVVLTFEGRDLPPRLLKLTTKVPCVDGATGFSFFCKAPVDYSLFDQLRLVFPDFAVPKTDGLIELLPLSISCGIPNHGMSGAPCPPHQYKLWEWVGKGLDLPMPAFSDFVKRVV